MREFFSFENFSEFLSGGEKRWKAIADMSLTLTKDQGEEPAVDDQMHSRLAELTRIAELNVSSVLGLDVSSIKITPVKREDYVKDTVEAYRPYFEVLEAFTSEGMQFEISSDMVNLEEMLNDANTGIGPLLTTFIIAMSMGNLTLEAMSSYELIVPRTTNSKEIMLVVKNIESFMKEWSLDEDTFWLWMCLSQLSIYSVISISHIQNEMISLVKEFARSFESSTGESLRRLGDGLEDLEGEVLESMEVGEDGRPDMSFLEGKLMNLVSNEPEILLGAQISEVQESISEQLSSLVAVVRGLSQFVLDSAVKKVFGSNPELRSIKEAIYRKQATPTQAVNMVSRLLGIDMSVELRDLGIDFVSAISENEEAIAKLLESVEYLPTPTELGAPTLWLARVGLDEN